MAAPLRLRTSSCDRPGFTRVRCGRGFRYRDAEGEPVTDPDVVCRASYIGPRIFELFEEGETIGPALTRLGEHGDFGRPATQGAVEAAVLDLLGG